MFSDPIADMMTRIRNCNIARRDRVDIPGSRMKVALASILKKEGFIRDFEFTADGKQGILRVYLRYGPGKERIITGIKRISKPGLRVYAGKKAIPRVLRGLGVAILSTPRGLMTDREARAAGVGGEVICYVW
ncbi:MAG: 30S ribosomal protein S8 [Firmicutes bacterium]|nr:30S ribosomal protein S8 [Bacillota bacterium]